jgi:hypothetical protein
MCKERYILQTRDTNLSLVPRVSFAFVLIPKANGHTNSRGC